MCVRRTYCGLWVTRTTSCRFCVSIIFIWHWRVRNYGAARVHCSFVHCCILLLALLAVFLLFLPLLLLEMYTLHIPLRIYDEYAHRHWHWHWHSELKRQKQQNFCTILLLTHSLRAKLASDIRGANISVKYTITEWNCKLYQVVAWNGMVLSFPLLFSFSIGIPPHLSVPLIRPNSLCYSIILFSFRSLFSHVRFFFSS